MSQLTPAIPEMAKHHVTVTIVSEIAKHHVTVTVVRERSQTACVILWTLCEARDTSHATGRLALAEQELAAASTNGGTIVETRGVQSKLAKGGK